MKQQGHFTSLQLKSMNQWTKQYVQTSALHNSSRGWHSIFKQIGHWGCSCSKVSGDTVSTVLVGYLPNFGNDFMRAVFLLDGLLWE